jgi:hypothetical protein
VHLNAANYVNTLSVLEKLKSMLTHLYKTDKKCLYSTLNYVKTISKYVNILSVLSMLIRLYI